MKQNNYLSRTEPKSNGTIQRRTFFSFLLFALANGAGFLGWKWLNRQPPDDGALQPLREALQQNEAIFSRTFSPQRLAKTYSPARAVKNVRRNGTYGLHNDINGEAWRLTVLQRDGSQRQLTMGDIKKLPKQELVFNFKCIEGWSQIQHWSGVPLADFLAAYGWQAEMKSRYLGVQTPDKKYYVGIDMQSALHPQTMLCYEMNGQPLTPGHGYPLRLMVPVKYGIKSLKCVGTLFFSDEKPPDYWAQRGYDYYAGL